MPLDDLSFPIFIELLSLRLRQLIYLRMHLFPLKRITIYPRSFAVSGQVHILLRDMACLSSLLAQQSVFTHKLSGDWICNTTSEAKESAPRPDPRPRCPELSS